MTSCTRRPIMHDPKDHPFRVVDGGLSEKRSRTETVRTTVDHEGVRLVLHDHTEVWEITDPGAWDGVDFCDLPPLVAYITLGLTGCRGLYTRDDAARAARAALERNALLTSRRELLLSSMPSDHHLSGSLLSMETWWLRWWPALAHA